MAKKKKKKTSIKQDIKKAVLASSLFKKSKTEKLPKVKKLTDKEIREKLDTRRHKSLVKIIESKGASASTKARAKRLLG